MVLSLYYVLRTLQLSISFALCMFINYVSILCFSYWFNAALLETIDTTNMKIEASDFVLVIDSYTKVKALQEEYFGGWQEIMRKVTISNLFDY